MGAPAESSPPLPPCPRLRCHQLKEDTEFQEFLSVHQKRTQTATWANDALDAEPPKGKGGPASDYLNFDSDSGQESDEEGVREDPKGKGTPRTPSLQVCAHPQQGPTASRGGGGSGSTRNPGWQLPWLRVGRRFRFKMGEQIACEFYAL